MIKRYTIEMFRTPQGHIIVEFVEYVNERRRVEHSLDYDNLKSKQQLESFAHHWMITGKVLVEARLITRND